MAFLEIAGLRKRYAAQDVLKNIDVDLDKGGFLVLVGPSGCGKSTLLHMIAGLESITDGRIRLDGNVINDLHPAKRAEQGGEEDGEAQPRRPCRRHPHR